MLATLWRVTRKDGQVLRFTDRDADIGLGPEVFEAAAGYRRSAVRAEEGMAASSFELDGVIDSAAISEADLLAGRFDGALVEIYVVNWATPADGTVQLKRGRLGSVVIEPPGYRVEFLDLGHALETVTGEVYAADCFVSLGSARCGVRLDPPAWAALAAYTVRQPRDARTGSVVKPSVENGRHFVCATAGVSGAAEPAWDTGLGNTTADGTVVWTAIQALTVTGTVDASAGRRHFTDAARAEATGFWRFGLATFTSGANAGLAMEIDDYDSGTGAFTLKLELPFDLAPGDGYSLAAGCDKTLASCKTKFDNVENFRGHGVHLPGNEEILRYPDAR